MMKQTQSVPFVDLYSQYEGLREEIDTAIAQVIRSSSFILGRFVEEFEASFAGYCDTRDAVAVNSGTSALQLALVASGVGPGDEVITVPNTFVATAEAICMAGARPVFVDVESSTQNMDPAAIEAGITPRTKAIIPVHLCGQPASMDPVLEIARRHDLIVVEDACQAHGATYKGKKAGSMGDAGCFSFYPGKNLGAFGEGGCIVTDREDIARNARMLRDHGQENKHRCLLKGFNCRMEGLQAAVLGVKLTRLDAWTRARQDKAERYNAFLKGSRIAPPEVEEDRTHVYHLYVVRTEHRDALAKKLSENGIATGIHYPVPIHLQEAYRDLGYRRGDFPVAEDLAGRILSLPLYPELSDVQIDRICGLLTDGDA